MQKDFDGWNEEKIQAHAKEKRVFFHEREVWWCTLGVNIGFEQDGKGERFVRPVLVFKKFNNEAFWAIPLSTIMKKGKFYAPLYMEDGMKRVAILSQLRFMDGKRLIDKIGFIDISGVEERR